MPYTWTWIIDPPVKEITSPSEFKVLYELMMTGARKFPEPAPGKEAAWEREMEWADPEPVNRTFNRALAECDDDSLWPYKFCAYMPSGRVAGLMSCTQRPSKHNLLEVWDVAMLPGWESEGTILIEHAVNLSQRVGYEGRVYFDPFARAPYSLHRSSFLRYIENEFIVPRESKSWEMIDNRWRLAKLLPTHPPSSWLIGREITGKIVPPRFPGQPKWRRVERPIPIPDPYAIRRNSI